MEVESSKSPLLGSELEVDMEAVEGRFKDNIHIEFETLNILYQNQKEMEREKETFTSDISNEVEMEIETSGASLDKAVQVDFDSEEVEETGTPPSPKPEPMTVEKLKGYDSSKAFESLIVLNYEPPRELEEEEVDDRGCFWRWLDGRCLPNRSEFCTLTLKINSIRWY